VNVPEDQMPWSACSARRGACWLAGGADADVVVSSRVRLARNLCGYPFLSRATPGQRQEVIAAVRPYFELIAVSMIPTLVFQAWRQFGEALGRPWEPMAIMLASVALNVVLNWILIYGNWGAPALGLEGAGWATLASRWVSVVVIFVWLRQAPALRAAWPATWFSGYRWGRFREMLAFGIPAAGGLIFESGAFAAAAVMMGWINATALAAHQIAIQVIHFTFLPAIGVSETVSALVGQAIGARRLRLVSVVAVAVDVLPAVRIGGGVLVGGGLGVQYVAHHPVVERLSPARNVAFWAAVLLAD
jgi:MATE family multidrug resistance protein